MVTGGAVVTVVAVVAIAVLGAAALYAMRRMLGRSGSASGSRDDARSEALAALYQARNELREQAQTRVGTGSEEDEATAPDGTHRRG